ncbi:bifunctional lysylphosphatidylglycerol flippase/synthetase MprF [Shewanella sp. MEBiC00475]|uniref:bifunctional lysylphosphatidylglycerol flippase/synthetase MprF n=1 Tax=Shewanella sp. MEBiC00475 TaxID=2575361 RepID=UPI0010BFF125|nr:bifunctional lysylphosphatidylglycerol flippase/synthetase MprF [Shewanella sp. MEBiC00475]
MLQLVKKIMPFLGVFLFIVAILVVHYELDNVSYATIVSTINLTYLSTFLLALFITLIDYLTLTCYDFLGLKYLGKQLPKGKVVLASMIGFSISNNIGHALISGPSVRYRFYSILGITGIELIKLSIFISIMFFLGTLTLAVLAYIILINQDIVTITTNNAVNWVIYLAAVSLIAYWVLILTKKTPFSFKGFEITLPSINMTLAQTAIAAVDLILASSVLFIFLHQHIDISFITFLLVFLIAQAVGLYSQVPGGLGVFEAVFISLLGHAFPAQELISAMILYRITYYFIPLLLSGIAILCFEFSVRLKNINSAVGNASRLITQNTPQVFGLLMLLAGGIMLFSGATPSDSQVMNGLRKIIPLSVVEISYILNSIVGMLLLLLAGAVRRRVNASYYASITLLCAGVILSLTKGGDWQEALIIGTMLLLMLPTRSHFYRESTLIDSAFSNSWFILIILIAVSTIWIGFFSFKHVEYHNRLWWQFAFSNDVSRFLRSSIIIIAILIAYIALKLLRSPKARYVAPRPELLQTLLPLIKGANDTNPHLALLGDKLILIGKDNQSFLMYGVTAKYWIVMGDPVGCPIQQQDLLWQLRDMADKKSAKLACYQISKVNLPFYLDMGLVIIKLGEEGKVNLTEFSLEGSSRSRLRQADNKMKKLSNISFEVLNCSQVSEHLVELKNVSDQWLENKSTHEKQFSLGFFNESYIVKTPCAVVKKDDLIVAFANLWQTDNKNELSIDLMRFTDEAPTGVMEWLTIKLMLWGKEQGYQHFNMGMAPLSGLDTHELAPLWHKVGHIIFESGCELYNFEGLRRYKEKFDPTWESRYLALPNSLSLLPVMLSITSLISGGTFMGALKK